MIVIVKKFETYVLSRNNHVLEENYFILGNNHVVKKKELFLPQKHGCFS
jgi:hypothetical protein